MRYLLIAMLAIFAACAGDEQSEFSELEREVAYEPVTASVTELLSAYSDWLKRNPETGPEHKEVLLKMYNLSNEQNRLAQKTDALQLLIMDYPDDPENVAWQIELSSIMEALRKNMAAQVINQSLVEKFPENNQVKAEVAPRVPASDEPVDSMITDLGRAMFNDSTLRLNPKLGRQFVDACEAYATVYDGKPESAELLHKAAETARSLNQLSQALDIYDWIILRYPDHKRTSQALFLKAFTYDSDLQDTTKARRYYSAFLEQYPNDDFAQSAEFLLQNLGKDDEELLEILQNKTEQ